jgi:transcriptional regulator with XRE-family HTH domain
MRTPLGPEIRRFRLKAGLTLRGLARQLSISAAHLSDIEHDHRRPSDALLRKIAHALQDVGATFESLDLLVTGIDSDTREWVATTAGVRKLLRKVRESGTPLEEILPVLEKAVARSNGKKSRKGR